MPKKPKATDDTVTGRLRRSINESGLSHYRLAKDSDTTPAVVGRFVSGERDLRGAKIDRLCKALGLELMPKAVTDKPSKQ